MHNTCISSTISLSFNGSLSFSPNDYTCLLNDSRFDRNPISLSPSSCCNCCTNSIYRVPINPSFLYGLRQSSLIQWSPCRRFILDGGDRFSRLPLCCIVQNCYYEKSYSLREGTVSGRRGKWGKGRNGGMVSEGRSQKHRVGNVDDAEVILSLLSEEVGEECFGSRERNGRSFRRAQVENRGNSGRDCYRSVKKNVGSGGFEGTLKECESVRFQSMEQDKRRKEEREGERKKFSRGETRRARKEGSSCSSYYSFSSGEFESDTEVQVKADGYVEKSSSGFKRDPKSNGEIAYDGEVVEGVEKHMGYAEEHGGVLKKENTAKGLYAASSGVECDWRKKSEKKLTEVSIEEKESRKESSQNHLRSSEVYEIGYGKPSNIPKEYDDREKKSTVLAVNIEKGTRQRYSQTGDQIAGQSDSRMKYKQSRDMSEIHSSVIEPLSRSQKRYSGGEENLTASVSLDQETTGEHRKTGGRITRQDEYRRNSQQLAEVSEIQEVDVRRTSTSQRQFETRSDDAEDQHHQKGQWATKQMDSRGKSQQLIEMSDMHDVDTESMLMSRRKSDTRVEKQEENSDLTFISYPEAKEQSSGMDSKAIRKMESRKGSPEVTNYNDTEEVTNTQRVSEKRTSSKERYLALELKSVKETRERPNLTNERVLRIGSRKEDQRPIKVSSFHEGMSEVASSSQASLKLDSQLRVQQIGVNEGDNRTSQAMVKSPSSPLVARGPLHVEPTSSGSLGSDSNAIHADIHESYPALQHEIYGGARRNETREELLNFISLEDALGSASRLQKSSMHFVGEFVEKVRREVSTSEVQKEKKTHETKPEHEYEQHEPKGVSPYGSGDSQPKDHDSKRTSWGSGTKGPSAEMWDVNDPSIKEQLETEVPEGTTTAGNDVVRRTGRSMWSIIADIVRMRWASRSETRSKSGGRSSPNQSTSSEAWFSGHEPDENNDENVTKERRSVPQEPSSVDQQQPGGIRIQSQEEASGSSLEEKIKHVGVGSLSSSNIETDSASKGISSSSIEETSAKHFQGTSGTAVAESSFPLPALRMRRSPVVDEILEAGRDDASASGTMVQIDKPVPTGLTEVSGTEGKDGELKQRKLQRNNQVLKDRFDDWEEAYKLETEQRKIDEVFMKEALVEAKKAADMWEVPVGAVLVQHGKIIARGYNLVEELRDSTAHAEMICIREASNILQTWRLSETTLYVTLEPCPMCAGAILQARIDTVVWGTPNKLLGADGSWIRLFPNGGGGEDGLEPTDKPAAPVHPFHQKIKIRRGVLASECADAMQQFFQLRRRKKEKRTDPPTPPSCLPISTRPSKLFSKMHDAFNIMFCL